MLRHVSIHRAEDKYIKNEFCERLFSDISKENIVAGQRKMMLEWGEHVHRLGGQNTEGNSEDSGEI